MRILRAPHAPLHIKGYLFATSTYKEIRIYRCKCLIEMKKKGEESRKKRKPFFSSDTNSQETQKHKKEPLNPGKNRTERERVIERVIEREREHIKIIRKGIHYSNLNNSWKEENKIHLDHPSPPPSLFLHTQSNLLLLSLSNSWLFCLSWLRERLREMERYERISSALEEKSSLFWTQVGKKCLFPHLVCIIRCFLCEKILKA